MKIENQIKYIESWKDWKQITRTDKVNANGGLQEGFFFGKRYSVYSGTKIIQNAYPVLIRREKESIIEDIIGEGCIVHDELTSGDYSKLNKFLRMECNS